MGFYPRKRARSNVPHVKAWASDEGGQPKLQGFAGYKAGMTHILAVDYRPASVTAGQEVRMPVTVIETPPMAVVAIRVYETTSYGLKTLTEVWSDKVHEGLFEGTMHVLVGLPGQQLTGADATVELVDAADELVQLLVADVAGSMQDPGVCAGTVEVVARQSPVEVGAT